MTTRIHGIDMVQLARRVLSDNAFEPDLPAGIEGTIPPTDPEDDVSDLRDLAWSSIDNHDSRDLDQIEAAEALDGGSIRILVGIADVDALVPHESPVDQFARFNSLTLYTGVPAAIMLSSHIGQTFDAIVTGATDKGTYVRLLAPPAEGRVVRNEHGLDVGDRVRVELLATDPARGFVDFEAKRPRRHA